MCMAKPGPASAAEDCQGQAEGSLGGGVRPGQCAGCSPGMFPGMEARELCEQVESQSRIWSCLGVTCNCSQRFRFSLPCTAEWAAPPWTSVTSPHAPRGNTRNKERGGEKRSCCGQGLDALQQTGGRNMMRATVGTGQVALAPQSSQS